MIDHAATPAGDKQGAMSAGFPAPATGVAMNGAETMCPICQKPCRDEAELKGHVLRYHRRMIEDSAPGRVGSRKEQAR